MLRLVSNRTLGGFSRGAFTTLHVVRQFSLENAVDHCNNPQNVGSRYDPMVGMDLVGAPACGVDMKIHIKCNKKTRKIVDARSKTFGCGLGVAFSSIATGCLKGLQMEGVSSIKKM